MKRKLILGLLLSATAAFPLPFGIGDIVWDPQTMAQVEQDIREIQKLWTLEQQTQLMLKEAIAAGRYGNWRAALSDSLMTATLDMSVATRDSDSARLRRLTKALQTATTATQESLAVMGQPSTSNAALLSLVTMQQTMAQMERGRVLDQMNRNLAMNGIPLTSPVLNRSDLAAFQEATIH
jgi:hypothetical protein